MIFLYIIYIETIPVNHYDKLRHKKLVNDDLN